MFLPLTYLLEHSDEYFSAILNMTMKILIVCSHRDQSFAIDYLNYAPAQQ